ncbi:hypothetical protein QJS10_CPA16g00407 [Acorus calamus]|uniref:Storage protein n=1 Tax=Acorus calamus TaxID=4465 RepID=A0AAV9D4X6_ACOCL|nr:hypothetical protein QJS10_CPA16g00407 [Acorus calamus]
MTKPGNICRSGLVRKPNESMRLIITTFVGVVFGFLLGISYPTVTLTRFNFPSSIFSSIDLTYSEDKNSGVRTQALLNRAWATANNKNNDNSTQDLPMKQKYLVTFTVGYDQKSNIDAAVKKFSENFTILLFHYDGRASEWDEFEWSKRAIHVSARKQTKWWYAKRFLHPDIVAPYEYIFIWDEDLGVEHFDAEKYIQLVKKHGLEISQPGLEPNRGLTWQMTKRRGDREVHKFVEIMATVFSRDAWRCVWHMIQNDLVHGWGLDFALRKCVDPAHEKIGVVDAQWIAHQGFPSLGNQGQAQNGRPPWEGVRDRCRKEWAMFQARLADAEKAYYIERGITPPNSTAG